jgi:hypothetical protein
MFLERGHKEGKKNFLDNFLKLGRETYGEVENEERRPPHSKPLSL